MATMAPRQALIVKIQRQLSSLNTSQLQAITQYIDDGSITDSIDEFSDTDLYELIVDFLRGDMLKSQEDEGMTQLLLLDDLIADLQRSTAAPGPGGEGSVHIQREDQTTVPAPALVHSNTFPSTTPEGNVALLSPQPNDLHSIPHDYSPGQDRDIGTPPRSLAAAGQTSRNVGPPLNGVSPSSSLRNQVLSISDVASLLPRREFRLHGRQISGTGSDVSHGNLCKQINEGLLEAFSESEVIRSVLKGAIDCKIDFTLSLSKNESFVSKIDVQ